MSVFSDHRFQLAMLTDVNAGIPPRSATGLTANTADCTASLSSVWLVSYSNLRGVVNDGGVSILSLQYRL